MRRENGRIAAAGMVRPDEEYFQDHFPGFPVVPGVLILEIFKKIAQQYFADSEAEFFLREIGSVKFSSYLRPGDAWEAELDQVSLNGGLSGWKGRLMSQGRVVCSAQFLLQKTDKEK